MRVGGRIGFLATLGVAAPVAASCSGSGPEEPPGSSAAPSASAAPAASVTPPAPAPTLAAPSPSAVPTGPVSIQPDTDLAPGTYVTAGFRPRTTFTLGDAWHAGFDDPTHFDLFMGGPRQLTFFSGVRGTVDQATARVRGAEGLEAGPVEPAAVGAYEGSSFDAGLAAGAVLPFAPVGYELHVGDEMRVIAIDVEGRTLMVAVQAANGDLDAFLEPVGEVLASVRFGA